MNTRSFRFEQDGPVATLRLDRPQAMNALTFDVYRELTDTFRQLAGLPEVRAVVLTGTGRAFCTGGDVREIIGPLLGRDEKALFEFTTLTCDLIRAMRELPVPIVASLNGPVAGAGAALALACDFRLAADTARIAFLFVKVGLSGADMGACCDPKGARAQARRPISCDAAPHVERASGVDPPALRHTVAPALGGRWSA